FAKYFARVGQLTDGQRDTLAWLPTQPKLLTELMSVAGPADPPDRVLEVLRTLRADYHDRLEEFAGAAAAMCVVWDAPERFPPAPGGEAENSPIDSAEISRLFGHFVRN